MAGSAVYSVDEVAELTGCSTWLIYDLVKRDQCPWPFVRLGKRLVFPRPPIDRSLELEPAPEAAS